MMRLVDLPADVLLRVLALCDVDDVLRIETTCRVLQDIAASRHLWLAHLRGLPNECAPDLPPHVSLESLDCIGLKSLVVRAVRGNKNWNSPSPKATREIKVIFDKPIRKPALVVEKAYIVSGGDYLVVQWSTCQSYLDDYVQLLEVSNGEQIWLYPDPDCSDSPARRLWGYGVDRIAENVLRVALAVTDSSTRHKVTAIKVFEIDLRQRRSDTIYDHRLNGVYPRNLYLQGDHIVLVGHTKDMSFLDWKFSCCASLKCDSIIGASRLVRRFLFTVHFPVHPAKNFTLRVTDVHQALEAVSGLGRPPPAIHMNTSPAETEADFQLSNCHPYAIDMQAFNAFWRQESNIYICLFASFHGNHGSSIMALPYSFTPQARTFEYKYTASLHLDGDELRPGIVSSQSGRLAVPGSQGLYGSDIHRIIRDEPNDRLCRKLPPRGIDCYGMDPYSGAILWMEKRSSSSKSCEARISYFD
ncbi:hypothetical protein DFH11DRAFT_311075 [Phellopilus nigrolimitatus]|nr:hypothetical protein DFH11DRAFT_311075 [Phellopilus nigrolimitatus]